MASVGSSTVAMTRVFSRAYPQSGHTFVTTIACLRAISTRAGVPRHSTTAHFESNTRSGWTVGGGLKYAVGYGWSVKSEFLYVKFDDFTTFTNAPFGVGIVGPRDVKLEDYIWRAGLNYKFW